MWMLQLSLWQMIATPLKTFKLHLYWNNTLHEIVLISYISLAVTHVRGNILERVSKISLLLQQHIDITNINLSQISTSSQHSHQFHNISLVQSKCQPPVSKKLLTKAEYGEVLYAMFNCSDIWCECCNSLFDKWSLHL